MEDWQRQLAESITTLAELAALGFRVPETEGAFPFRITPHILSRMQPDTATCPLGRQFVPAAAELTHRPAELRDPVCEEEHSIAGVMVHAYPARALIMGTPFCTTYCRYCFRKRLVGQIQAPQDAAYEVAFAYLHAHPEIDEVILSGGDPLLLSDARIEWFLQKLAEIPSVAVVRIHSRVLSTLPMRITDTLCEILTRYDVQYLNTQINHPVEISPETETAVRRLRRAGVILGNQAVLLRGINDTVDLQRTLCKKLYAIGIRPYYLFQCDYTEGTQHFRTSIEAGQEIFRGLQGWLSGPSVPRYVIDTPETRKIILEPRYCEPMADGRYRFVNYEGEELIYDEPNLM